MSNFFKQNSLILIVLVPLLIAFFVCHLVFSYYDNLASDDYNIIGSINEKGLFGTVLFMYLNWEGSFGGVLLNTFILKLSSFSQSSFVHHFVSVVIVLLCFYAFIKSAAKEYFKITLLPIVSLLIAISFIAELYYTDLAIYDTWYWVCGNIYVLMPALFLGVLAIYINYKNTAASALLFFYCIIFGSSRFNYAILAISINIVLLARFYLKEKKINRTLLSCLILLILSLIIYVIAPGNYIRRSEELQRSPALIEYIMGPLKMSVSYVVTYVLVKIPYHFIYLIPAVWAISKSSSLFNKEQVEKITSVKTFVFLTVLILAFVYIQSFSMFLAKGSQAYRTLVMLNFLVSAYLTYALVVVFYRFYTKKLFYALVLLCVLAGSALLSRRLQLNYNGIRLYSEKLILRNSIIKDAIVRSKTEKIDTLKLKPLPPAGYFHNTELTKRNGNDPMNNIFLENYYKPNFVLDIEE